MSTVVLDTITGKSTATTITIGPTPVVSASANSMTIRGEGSNQTSIQQGLAKCWANTEQASSYSTRDSFNLSSIADGGTGKTQLTFTNAFGNANHASTAMASNLNNFVGNDIEAAAQATTTVNLCSVDGSNSLEDASVLTSSTHGDLA